MTGVIRREDLIKALCLLGGQPRGQGGEMIIVFPGSTVIVGRRDYSRRMLRRVERKLLAVGISPLELHHRIRRHAR